MSFPFSLLLIPYFLMVMIFFVISGFGIFHTYRFSFKAPFAQTVLVTYLTVSALIIIISLLGIFSLDWSQVWELNINQ